MSYTEQTSPCGTSYTMQLMNSMQKNNVYIHVYVIKHHTLELVLWFRRGRSACNIDTRSSTSFSVKFEVVLQLFWPDMVESSDFFAKDFAFSFRRGKLD